MMYNIFNVNVLYSLKDGEKKKETLHYVYKSCAFYAITKNMRNIR